MVTCRRADGEELPLGELPLATVLGSAQTIRAEEIELSVPGGPSVSTLLSVTPVRGDSGVETVVITLQDLAPRQELDRMTGLIGDLFDAGSIDAGTLSVAPEPSGAGALIDEARHAQPSTIRVVEDALAPKTM